MHGLRHTVVLAVVGDVGAVATVEHLQFRVFGEGLQVALLVLLALLLDEGHSLVDGHRHGVGALGQRDVFLVVQHVGAEASGADDDVAAFELSHRAGQSEQFQGFVERQRLHGLVGGQLGEARLLLVVGRAYLHHGAEAANLHEHRLARCGVDAHLSLAGLVFGAGVDDLLHRRFELLVEARHHLVPLRLAFGNLIEVLLHAGGEVIVHDVGEVLHQEVVDDDADVGGQQFALLRTGEFLLVLGGDFLSLQRVDGEGLLGALLVAFVHVFALLYGGDGGCVGRGSSDAQFFQFVDERCLGVACGTLAEAFAGRDFLSLQHVALLHLRQQVALQCVGLLVVGGLAVHLQEAVELHHFAGGHEQIRSCCAFGTAGCSLLVPDFNLHRGLLQLGVGHLRGGGALPDEVVEATLLPGAFDVLLAHVGGAYGLVGLLGALRVGLEVARMAIVGTVETRDFLLARADAEA